MMAIIIVFGFIFLMACLGIGAIYQSRQFYKHNPDATFHDMYFGKQFLYKNVNGKRVKIPIKWDY